MKYIVIHAIIAIILYFMDTFYFNQGVISFLAGLVMTVIFLILTAVAFFSGRRELLIFRVVTIVIYIVMICAVSISIKFMNNMALDRAEKLIEACNSYRAKYERFPDKLEDLVPEFIPSVPKVKPVFFEPQFNYISEKDNHVIWYIVTPPFYRAFYSLESGKWSYLD